MRTLLIGRIGALTLGGATFVFLFLHDSWRSDNLFLVPDLVLCAVLLAAAALPARLVPPPLLAAFGYTAGVLATSVASYAVEGRLGLPSLIGALTALALAVALVPLATRGPA
ncbi:hypothetical protein [Plantactinospora sp. CA-290183]|uniref:hypothetical protein n=1 Tax=Plantactinospora sp. CA-290183 TaxID=3240006 RepID=UPI003D8A34C5